MVLLPFMYITYCLPVKLTQAHSIKWEEYKKKERNTFRIVIHCLSLFSRRDCSPGRGSSVRRVCAIAPETEETESQVYGNSRLWRNKIAIGRRSRSFLWEFSLKQALTEEKAIPQFFSSMEKGEWPWRFGPGFLPPNWWLRTSGTFSCAPQREVIPGSLLGKE